MYLAGFTRSNIRKGHCTFGKQRLCPPSLKVMKGNRLDNFILHFFQIRKKIVVTYHEISFKRWGDKEVLELYRCPDFTDGIKTSFFFPSGAYNAIRTVRTIRVQTPPWSVLLTASSTYVHKNPPANKGLDL